MSESLETEVEETETVISDLDVAIAVVQELHDDGESEDEMAIAIVRKGYKYERAGVLRNLALEALGLRLSRKARFESVQEVLVTSGFDPKTWDDVQKAVALILEKVESTSGSQALGAIKKFAKANNLEMPAKPKGATNGGASRTNAWDVFFAWANSNRDATEAEIVEFVISQGRSEGQAPKYASVFNAALKFARDFNS